MRMFVLAILMAGAALAQDAPPPPEPTVVANTGLYAEELREEILLFDEFCADETLGFTVEATQKTELVYDKKLKKKVKVIRVEEKVVERPVILCAKKPSDGSRHVIRLKIPYPLPECFRRPQANWATECGKGFPFRVETQGYTTLHVSGRGVGRLVFSVEHGGERLQILRMLHAWFPDGMNERNSADELMSGAQKALYTPYQDEYHRSELVFAGIGFLADEVDKALIDLRTKKVQSRAYPGKLLADVISRRMLMSLAAIEQMDHDQYKADPKKTAEAVYVEYALNREHSFRWSISSANAIGPYQFTESNGNGTYSLVVRECAGAGLIRDFYDGARDLSNAIKAAACLLDLELANLPLDVRTLYESNPRVGGIYPVAAYNEGGGGARQLYDRIKRAKIDLEKLTDDEIGLPDHVFRRQGGCNCPGRGGAPRERLNGETFMYVHKYLFLWKFLEEVGY